MKVKRNVKRRVAEPSRREIKPIKSEADYDAALEDIEQYFDDEPAPGTPEADRFDLLALVISDYEDKHWPIELPDPVAAIEFAMEQRGITRLELEPILGSRGRVSEVLNRKRHLTLPMIWNLNRTLKIPADALITPYALLSQRAAGPSPVRTRSGRRFKRSTKAATVSKSALKGRR